MTCTISSQRTVRETTSTIQRHVIIVTTSKNVKNVTIYLMFCTPNIARIWITHFMILNGRMRWWAHSRWSLRRFARVAQPTREICFMSINVITQKTASDASHSITEKTAFSTKRTARQNTSKTWQNLSITWLRHESGVSSSPSDWVLMRIMKRLRRSICLCLRN